MANNEQNNNKPTNKIQAGVQLDPDLHAILERFRIEEDRPMSNMISILLKTHPRIQPVLEAEAVAAGVPA